MQEAFLDLWRGAGRFDPQRSRPASYLLTFVHRRAVDLVRREQARPQRGGGVEAIAERAGRGRRRGLARRERAGSQRCARRSPGCRSRSARCSSSRTSSGLSQSEIAERLGEPLGTVKSRTHVALSRLRELLGEGFHA